MNITADIEIDVTEITDEVIGSRNFTDVVTDLVDEAIRDHDFTDIVNDVLDARDDNTEALERRIEHLEAKIQAMADALALA